MPVREVVHWAPTEAGNATDPEGFPDNYETRKTPENARELQAALFRYFQDALWGKLTTVGSGSAYAIPVPNASATEFGEGVPDGAVYRFVPHIACEAAPTLSVGGQLAEALVWPDGSALVAEEIRPELVVTVRHDLANTRFIVIEPSRAEASAVTQDTVDRLIEAAVAVGAPIWGRVRARADRIPWSANAVRDLASGQWTQSSDDPTLLYVYADPSRQAAFLDASAGDRVEVNGTEYLLAVDPSIPGANSNAVLLTVASLGGFQNAVEALSLRLRDSAIGEQSLLEVGASPGTIIQFAGSTTPEFWLECDGSAVSRAEHSALFAAIGTTYGVGDGAATFNLPDLRGRAAIGAGQGTGLTDRALGAQGGSETHALTEQELPAHSHTVAVSSSTHSHGAGTLAAESAGAHTHAISNGTTDQEADHRHAMPVRSGAGTVGPSQDIPDSISAGSVTRYTGYAGSHSHTVTAQADSGGEHAHSFSGTTAEASPAVSANCENTGGGQGHENMPPFVALKFIVKT